MKANRRLMRTFIVLACLLSFAAIPGHATTTTPVISYDAAQLQNEAGEFCPPGLTWALSPEAVETTLGISLGEAIIATGTGAANYRPNLGIQFPSMDEPYIPVAEQNLPNPVTLTFKDGLLSAVHASMPLQDTGIEAYDAILQAYTDAFGAPFVTDEQEAFTRNDANVLVDTTCAYWTSAPREDGRVSMLQVRLAVQDQAYGNLTITLYLLDSGKAPAQ